MAIRSSILISPLPIRPPTIDALMRHRPYSMLAIDSTSTNFHLKKSKVRVKVKTAQADPSRATAGPGETFLRGPKHFHGAPLGKIFSNFFFKMVHCCVFYKFPADGGAP